MPNDLIEDDLLLASTGPNGAAVTGRLISDYSNLVYAVALRHARGNDALAADITQAVFLTFLRQRKSIRSDRALPSWFLRVTLRTAARAQRDAERRRRIERASARPEVVVPPDSLSLRERLIELDRAIGRLRSSDQSLILMRYFQHKDLADIGHALATSESTARKRLTRAVQRIRRQMSQPKPDEDSIEKLLAGAFVGVAPQAVRSDVIHVHDVATPRPAAVALAAPVGLTKSMLLIGAIALILAVAVGSIVCMPVSVRLPSAPTLATPIAQPKPRPTRGQFDELKRAYALADGEVVRFVYPPYPAIRTVFFDDRYDSVMFHWGPGGTLATGVGRGLLDLKSILGPAVLRIPWYQVEAIDSVAWTPTRADTIERVNSTVEQRLAALAGIISDRSMVSVELQRRTETRLCIVAHGPSTKPAFKDFGDGRPVLLLTQTKWDDARMVPFANKKAAPYPPGTVSSEYLNPELFESLDTPFFPDHPANDLQTRLLVAPDAHLNHTSPGYAAQLRRAIDNVHQQLSCDWRIEPRDIVVYRFAPTSP